MLTNIYLDYVLDVSMGVKIRYEGYVELIRYADDFVICVQNWDEVEAIKEPYAGNL
jgi:hypothetical protein